MGCTSSKPKRTTSIEDVAGKQPHAGNQVPDKNGQVNKVPADKDKIIREKDSSKQNTETKPIEIPGAHLSFMAPDGIPFIDEDVESEADDGALAGKQVPANTVAPANDSRGKLASPDQNKNVTVVVNKEVKLNAAAAPAPAAESRTSALGEKENRAASPGDVSVDVKSGGGGVAVEPVVITEIKTQEIHITTTKNQPDGSTEVTEVRSRTVLSDKPRTEEERAATKIQAGIRGYLDRQKVKAIKANMQHSNEAHKTHQENTQPQSGPKVTCVVETVECHTEEQPDPKLDAAATKIQANYKGYKTRKEMKVQTK